MIEFLDFGGVWRECEIVAWVPVVEGEKTIVGLASWISLNKTRVVAIVSTREGGEWGRYVQAELDELRFT
jgi:hypothetical protein